MRRRENDMIVEDLAYRIIDKGIENTHVDT